MSRRTLAALALPAVVAAMTVAVPALAGSSSGGGTHNSTAHKSSAPKASTAANCFTALVGKRHVRECAVAGPRGPRGVRGFLGPNGPRGVQGKTGKQGATGEPGPAGSAGPPGTARAYALVQPEAVGPNPSPSGLVSSQSAGFIAVRRSAPGIYCLAPASSINPATAVPVASGEVGYSAPGVVPLAAVDVRQPGGDCNPNELGVRTYNLAPGPKGEPPPPQLSNQVAFTIIVP
jgi:Collagen triple helix repeat (20 copies)